MNEARTWRKSDVLTEARRLGLGGGLRLVPSAVYGETVPEFYFYDRGSKWTVRGTDSAVLWLRGYEAGKGWIERSDK